MGNAATQLKPVVHMISEGELSSIKSSSFDRGYDASIEMTVTSIKALRNSHTIEEIIEHIEKGKSNG